MGRDELLKRIEAQLAEGNELMRENRKALRESRRAYEDQSDFMREMLLRFDKIVEGSDLRWRATLAESELRWRATLERYFGPSGDGEGPAAAGA